MRREANPLGLQAGEDVKSDSPNLQISDRSKLRRIPKKGSQERELIHSILDEALIAHVGFVSNDQPYCYSHGLWQRRRSPLSSWFIG